MPTIMTGMTGIKVALICTAIATLSACGGPEIEITGDVGVTNSAVAVGCMAPVTCTGTKTCTAWSAWSDCGATFCGSFAACVPPDWGTFCGRSCPAQSWPGTATPHNRYRDCTMKSNGSACREYQYGEPIDHCGPC